MQYLGLGRAFAAMLWIQSIPVQAEAPLSADALDKITLGNAYVIRPNGGKAYGITVFHPNRTVTWYRFGQECSEGTWHEPEPGYICFDYSFRETPPCWSFFNRGDFLELHYEADPEQQYFYSPPINQTSPCAAPSLS